MNFKEKESMTVSRLRDKKIIESHFRKNTDLNLYQIGDLDDFFWEYTDWYALSAGDELKQIILLYFGTDLPVIMALCDRELNEMKSLLNKITSYLPKKFYSHLSEGLAEVLEKTYNYAGHGKYLKMSLRKENLNCELKDTNVKRLTVSDLDSVKEFYSESYPDNWFDKRMLETGKYFGYFVEGKIAGISGIHVYSPLYKVAALGNITTHPFHRGKSICTMLTSVLCKDLFKTVDKIGLNVHSENKAAIRSYEKVGFKITGKYEEYMFERK